MTKRSPLYRRTSNLPERAAILPAMMIAGSSFDEIRDLIDRGIRSDGTWPVGTGYLIETSDTARNVRAPAYDSIVSALGHAYHLEIAKPEATTARRDVVFYFTGKANVPELSGLHFLDGAIADHLTSFGGMLLGSSQMSSLAWLSAGATGSYGTVVEPCNFPGKFPAPGLVILRYLMGSTLIEAYWEAVEMPGQGVFIGEPLARPFGGWRIRWSGSDLLLATRTLAIGDYDIQEAPSFGDAFRTVERTRIRQLGVHEVRVRNANPRHAYRILPAVQL